MYNYRMADNENLRLMIVRLLSDVYEKLLDLETRLSALESGSTVMPLGSSRQPITDLIISHFDRSEIDELAFEVDYLQSDQIPGHTRGERARYLVLYCERRAIIHNLLILCQTKRPSVNWPRPPID